MLDERGVRAVTEIGTVEGCAQERDGALGTSSSGRIQVLTGLQPASEFTVLATTSTPSFRFSAATTFSAVIGGNRLRPLISVSLDLVLMRLLSGGPPVWVFLDELPTINKLPKLPEALAFARKPNVRLVRGLQGRAQLKTRYGPESEAMLSQPARAFSISM